jgi:phage baseplate assembly protein W
MPSTSEIKGIDFPFRMGSSDFPKKAEGIEVITARVNALLTTGLGEIPMMPEQGSVVHKYIFETMTPLMRSHLANEIRTQINAYVPQLKVTTVTTEVVDERVYVLVNYVLDGVAGELTVDFGTPTSP